MGRWSAEQVAKLAPDAASLSAARKLAVPAPWSDTGATDTLLWGKCQGSGKTPYQVSVDLTGPAFRCSCPSRKFPCKHALALMMLWVQGAGTIADSSTAAAHELRQSAQEWAAGRAARTTAADAVAAAKKPVAPEARAKRVAERMELMDSGVAELQTWLADVVRGGTAGARQRAYSWWDGAAARLVDTQLPGLAQQVRDLGSDVATREDWPDHLLRTLGRLWAATCAWTRRDQLTKAELGDLRAFIGWPFSSEEIRQGETVSDRWHVLGAWRTDNGRLLQQRTWLWGEQSAQAVLVLDFAAGGQVLPVAQVTGAVLQATLALYPGTTTRRGLFVDEPVAAGAARVLAAGVDLQGAVELAAVASAGNPWSALVPVQLTQVRLDPLHGAVDRTGAALPLVPEAPLWWLLAVSGGHPVDVFAELDEHRLRPLSVVVDGEYLSCA